MKVKVRGIYSTALTKMLIDGGMQITQANEALQKAFSTEDQSEPDVVIEDIDSKEGVYVYETADESVVKLIKSKLKDSVFFREEIGRIYCGIIKSTDPKSKSIVIDLGNGEEGVLDLKNFWGYVKQGAKILVQSKGTYDGKMMLSTQFRLFGEDLVIIKNGFTKMSRGIRSRDGRDKLYDIAKNFDLKDWGILWLQGAETKEESVLREELEKLVLLEKDIGERFEKCMEPTVLYSGVTKFFVLFSKEDKKKLDRLRMEAMPTISGHHQLKSAGYTILTDMAEELLDKASDKELSEKISKTLLRYGPIKGKLYKLLFTRLNGTSYTIEGIVDDIMYEKDQVKLLTVRSRGDWGERYFTIEPDKEYVLIKKQDSEEKVLVFKPEIFPKFAKIVSFDIIVRKEGDKTVAVNDDRLEKMVKKGEISEELGKHFSSELATMKEI